LGEAEDKASKIDMCIGFAFEGKMKLVEELQKLQEEHKSLELKPVREDIENTRLEELRSKIRQNLTKSDEIRRNLIEREEVQKLQDQQKTLESKTLRTADENKELAKLQRNMRENYESAMLLHPEVIDEAITVHFISGSKTLEETTVYESKKTELEVKIETLKKKDPQTDDEKNELEKLEKLRETEPKWQIYGVGPPQICSTFDARIN
jgi:hypothetical protein